MHAKKQKRKKQMQFFLSIVFFSIQFSELNVERRAAHTHKKADEIEIHFQLEFPHIARKHTFKRMLIMLTMLKKK